MLPVVGVVVAIVAVFVILDAFLRRCRSCNKLLAAQVLRVIERNDRTETRYRCCFCSATWATRRHS